MGKDQLKGPGPRIVPCSLALEVILQLVFPFLLGDLLIDGRRCRHRWWVCRFVDHWLFEPVYGDLSHIASGLEVYPCVFCQGFLDVCIGSCIRCISLLKEQVFQSRCRGLECLLGCCIAPADPVLLLGLLHVSPTFELLLHAFFLPHMAAGCPCLFILILC